LVTGCYYELFAGCIKIDNINAAFLTEPGTQTTYNWVNGVAPTGTFVKNASATWNVTGEHGVPTGWTTEVIYDHLYIEAQEDEMVVTFTNDINYSLDGINYTTLTANTNSPSVNTGQKIYFKDTLEPNN
jgi:hypothetical protein